MRLVRHYISGKDYDPEPARTGDVTNPATGEVIAKVAFASVEEVDEAVAAGESPTDWKPSVCWQLPLKVDRSDDGTQATLRRWTRADWGPGGESMAWCCTEQPPDAVSAFVGDRPVIDELAEEVNALVGPEVTDAVRVEIGRRATGSTSPVESPASPE